MYEISVRDFINVTNAKLICGDENDILGNFVKDTREINLGDTYVGIKGDKFDGSIFFDKALENGATSCILEHFDEDKNKYFNKNILVVDDTVKALQDIAKYKREMYDIPIIGVTGSVGKTSTKDLIASVLSEKYNTLKTNGNYNNHIGVPLTILGLKEHEAAVIEMGMNHLGEISKVTKIARPTMSVITNIGTAHIGNLGSRENILKAKLEILEGMSENSPIIINNDNDMLHDWYLKNRDKRKIITYGIENKSDIMATKIVSYENGSKFCVEVLDKTYDVEVNVGGNHFVLNALCGICVGIQNNVPIEKILNGIKKFKLTANRMEIIQTNQGIKIINDSYNASYDSMKAALETLKGMNTNRKIAILGDILELGDFTKSIHEKVGEEVFKNNIDILITVGINAKFIANKAIDLGMNENYVFSYDKNYDAIQKIKEISKNGDCILIKASNGMRFKEILDELIYCFNNMVMKG